MKTGFTLTITLFAASALAQVPPIVGSPTLVTPDLLDWPDDFARESPNLSEPTSNRLVDFHGEIRDCDIVLSTAGNYHMALRDLWQLYLSTYVDDLDVRTWFYTTSPPVAPEHVQSNLVQIGNMNARCRPQVAVGPAAIINAVRAAGAAEGAAVPIIRSFGNVILVRKGNPKKISTVWDLGKHNVIVVTPNQSEGGSFANFTGSIYNIAANDPNPPSNMTAAELFNSIFNATVDGRAEGREKKDEKAKWVTGARIMHREIPWAIATGKADAGVIFYHLALHAVRTFPDRFEIVPLGGSALAPQPLPGNQIAVLQAVRINGVWNAKQLELRERLMDALRSAEFTDILAQHGMRRP